MGGDANPMRGQHGRAIDGKVGTTKKIGGAIEQLTATGPLTRAADSD